LLLSNVVQLTKNNGSGSSVELVAKLITGPAAAGALQCLTRYRQCRALKRKSDSAKLTCLRLPEDVSASRKMGSLLAFLNECERNG
jgi:hypothetical protein